MRFQHQALRHYGTVVGSRACGRSRDARPGVSSLLPVTCCDLFVPSCLCCLCNKLARHWFPPKTPHMQRRRDTPGSCRARSPALHVGRRDRVASCVHVHRTRMFICMHIWGSSLHLPPHRPSSYAVFPFSQHGGRFGAAECPGAQPERSRKS